LGTPWRLPAARWIASVTVLHNLRCALQCADLANTRYILSIPLDTKFEILVGIETLRVYGKFGHSGPPLGGDLPGDLLDLYDHEFRRLQRRKSHHDIHNPEIDIVLRSGVLIALDEICLLRLLPLERTLAKQIMHKCSDIQPDLRPERLVIRF